MARELLMRGATMIAMVTTTPTADQRVLMGLNWAAYEMLDASRGDRSVPRITYLDGVAELMSQELARAV